MFQINALGSSKKSDFTQKYTTLIIISILEWFLKDMWHWTLE